MGFRDQTWLLLWHAVLMTCVTVLVILVFMIAYCMPFWLKSHFDPLSIDLNFCPPSTPLLFGVSSWKRLLEQQSSDDPPWAPLTTRSWERWATVLIFMKEIELCAHVDQFEKQVCFELFSLFNPFLPTCMPKALKVSLESESLRVWFMNQRVR